MTDTGEVSKIVRLSASDFELDSSHPITLKNKHCGLVLFFVNNDESYNWVQVLLEFVKQNIVPMGRTRQFVGACNLALETEVAEAFLNKIRNTNTIWRQFAIEKLPTFLVYQQGKPITFYEGGDYTRDYDLYNRSDNITTDKLANFFTFQVCDETLQFSPQMYRRGLRNNRPANVNTDSFVVGTPYSDKEKEELNYSNRSKFSSRRSKKSMYLYSREKDQPRPVFVTEPIIVRAINPETLDSMYISTTENRMEQ